MIMKIYKFIDDNLETLAVGSVGVAIGAALMFVGSALAGCLK